MGDFFRGVAEDQKRNREDQLRREEMYREDQHRRDEAQQKLIEAMMARTEVRDIPPPAPAVTLPTLSEGGEVETFITALETALRIGEIPRNQWKRRLVSNIPATTLVKIDRSLTVEDATYDEVIGALRGGNSITFCSAAEDLSSGEKGKVFDVDIRTAASKMIQLIMTVAKGSTTMMEMAQRIAVARLRDHLVPPLKTYVDTGKRFQFEDFVCGCEEWVRSQPGEVSCFKKTRASGNTPFRSSGGSQPLGNGFQNRPRPNCFACGKAGHMARECRSRPPGEAATAPVTRDVQTGSNSSRGTGARTKADIVCYKCMQKGHKSPDCPTRLKSNKRVKLPLDKLVYSGAQISVVPEECVAPEEFTGDVQELEDFHTGRVTGRVCQVTFTIAGREFKKKAVTQPGELLRWTPCMAVPLNPREEMEFVLGRIEEKEAACREDIRYLPPTLRNGMVISGVMAFDGEVVPGYKVTKEVKEKGEAQQVVTSGSEENSIERAMKELAKIEVEGEWKKVSGKKGLMNWKR